ncbi:6-hydroxymethylpterin diphosphokinase MptE-like protein [Alishewanella longhuensis]
MKLAIQNQLALCNQLQQQNEKVVALNASERAKRNLDEFNRSIPNLAKFISNYELRNHSFFVTKDSAVNILIKSESMLVYPVEIEKYVSNQVADFFSDTYQHQDTLNASGKCLVIIGIGLGLHILKLTEKLEPNYLVIYEPEEDFLKLSLYTAPWFELLTLCNIERIQIFIQHGENSQNLASDLQELKQAFPSLGNLYYYRHFAYPKLDQSLSQLGVIQAIPTTAYDRHPYVLPFAEVSAQHRPTNLIQQQIFDKNLLFFQERFPELFMALQENSPQSDHSWQALQHNLGENSLFSDCSSNSLAEEKFLILKNPLVYGLTLSKKGNDIAFLSFISKLKASIDAAITNETECNLHFTEIILLGVLNSNACLAAAKASDRLLIIEESLNRFLLSCFTVNWFELASTKSFYFLIGQNARLEHIEACYQQGALNFIDSYIFQPYFTERHRKLSKNLLESIQSTNGKSNHFEARFKQLIRSYQNCAAYPILCRNSAAIPSMPVIVIGNGPSLEVAIASLKILRDQVLLVSCGTALATLLNNNIRPDYHIELEKETDTLTRLNKLPASELKCISLLATVEIHTAIPVLFKQALLMATTANPITELLYNSHKRSATILDYSYYTVTNFALDLLLQLNFQQIYLVGVDFGFTTIDTHHASSSNYFNEQGESVYDYELKHGATFEVQANLNSTCLTVPAFNAARLLMEQCLAAQSDNTIVYNVGHGAKIEGAKALHCLPDVIDNRTKLAVVKPNVITPAFIKTSAIDEHFSLLTSEDTANFIDDTLVLANQFCRSLLALWSTPTSTDCELRHTLRALVEQDQLLQALKIQSKVVFELFDGSCRYFSMLCHRYAKAVPHQH